MSKTYKPVHPTALESKLDFKYQCDSNGSLRRTHGDFLQGELSALYCITDPGTMLAMDADGYLAPVRAFAPGDITAICGVAWCVYQEGTEDGTVDGCLGEPCGPRCESYAPCATVEIKLDVPAALPVGTPIFLAVDPDHPEALAGNYGDVMGSIAGDVQIGAVERATTSECPTVYVRVGVDPKVGKA